MQTPNNIAAAIEQLKQQADAAGLGIVIIVGKREDVLNLARSPSTTTSSASAPPPPPEPTPLKLGRAECVIMSLVTTTPTPIKILQRRSGYESYPYVAKIVRRLVDRGLLVRRGGGICLPS